MTTPQDIRDAIEQFFEEKKKTIENMLDLAKQAIDPTKKFTFGTHISKCTHPSSQGDSVSFSAEHSLPKNLCASQSIPKNEYILDATGNAAALPLANFFDIAVNQTTLQKLLLQDDPIVHGVFADNEQQSLEYCRIFQAALKAENPNSQTDERNKQLLWFCPDETEENKQYQVLIPLYPASLAYCLFNKIKQRFSDEVKAARNAKENKQFHPNAYADNIDLAYVKFGSSDKQQRNVSYINSSKQGGKHFLLPSMPPQFNAGKVHFSRRAKSFFVDSLLYNDPIAEDLRTAFIQDDKHQQRQAVDLLSKKVLNLAANYQEEQFSGWTDSYQLSKENLSETYWLDQNNIKFVDNPATIPNHWQNTIAEHFATWLIKWLEHELPQKYFSRTEFMELLQLFKTNLLFGK